MHLNTGRRLYLGLTDQSWWEYLASQSGIDEVNFWSPSGKVLQAQQGTPFLFKLKAPLNAIAGVGFLERVDRMTIGSAWEFYGRKNGADTLSNLVRAIGRYRRTSPAENIGCTILSQPTFFSRDLWVAQPRDWSPNTQSGAYYDMDEGEGARVWAGVSERLGAAMPPLVLSPLPPVFGGYGAVASFLPRLGQGTFRRLVLSAYDNRCAVTGERAIPIVDAAHIRAFGSERRHEISNGIALRKDIHKLFDDGYVSIRPDLRFVVSPALREEFSNGETYYELQRRRADEPIRVPSDPQLRPNVEYLERHYSETFKH